MKRLIIALAILTTLGINVSAQDYGGWSIGKQDGFFSSYTDIGEVDRSSSDFILYPKLPDRYECIDQYAPIGSGWLLLAGMGAGYAILRRRKEK